MRLAVLAALLVAGCDQGRTIPSNQDLREFNQTHPVGRFQAVVKPDGSIWVLDTQTGFIQRCETTANANGQCAFKPVRM